MNFDNPVRRFDAGEITEAVIDELLLILHPDDPEARQERKERVMPDGDPDKMVKFQVIGLNKQAQQAYQRDQQQPARPETIEVPEQFQGDIPEEVYDGPDYVNEIKSRVGIVQAVRTWGKPQHRIKDNRTEGVKVRCPFSDHVDNDPSAWVNTSKQTWFCGKCQLGGDVIDFYAAAKHDLDPKQYHRTPEFARIVQEIADELGIVIVSTSDGGQYVEARTEDWASNQLDDEVEQVPEITITEPVPPSTEADEPITISDEELVRGLQLDDEIDIDELFNIEVIPSFEWRDLDVPEDTFLYSWMIQAEEEMNWVPYEYFLGLGLQAIGMACSHSTYSMTYGQPLTGSTLFVIVGQTGIGKSMTTDRLSMLIENARGPKFDKVTGSGVKAVRGIASAEAFIDRIKTLIADPLDPLQNVEVPTNAWFVEDEFQSFASKASRPGGSHIKQRLMRFHDFSKKSDDPELVAEDYSLAHRHREIYDSYFTATFLVQNKALSTVAENVDLVSGFFNRMIFFMGTARRQRSILDVPVFDPDPDYKRLYERMWNDCQFKKRVIPFSQDALELVMSHPLRARLETLKFMNDMFARWEHQMLRFAFLLAVNENSPYVEPKHVNASYRFVSEYVIPCAASVVKYVKTPEQSEGSELSDKIEAWVQGQFDKKGQWPELRNIKTNRWWNQTDPSIRNKALDLMFKEGRLITVKVMDAPNVKGARTHVLTPTGDFAVYDRGPAEKEISVKYDEFYGGNRNR